MEVGKVLGSLTNTDLPAGLGGWALEGCKGGAGREKGAHSLDARTEAKSLRGAFPLPHSPCSPRSVEADGQASRCTRALQAVS